MAEQNVRMIQRKDTEANWALENPILDEGEIGLNTTTGHFKMGDGVTDWNNLEYYKCPMKWDDIQNKPTIPTVNDGTLRFIRNGKDIAKTSMNSSSSVTVNIPVYSPNNKCLEIDNSSNEITLHLDEELFIDGAGKLSLNIENLRKSLGI